MTTVNLSSFAGAGFQFFDNNGVPLSGGLLYSYLAGTTTQTVTYTSNTGSIANSNPIVLDSSGRVSNEIWLVAGSTYKFVLQNSSGTQIGSWDNIPSINDATSLNNFESTLAGSSGSTLVGYVENDTGSQTRTVASKLKETISVLDFGADPTGATNSNTAINNAITALSGKGNLYFPPGNYLITSSIAIPNNSFIRFIGSGNISYPASIFTIGFNGAAFTSASGNTSFYCFENFYITQSSSSFSSVQFLIDSGTCVHGEFNNIIFTALTGKPMSFSSAFVCSFKHILVQNCNDYGITVSAGSDCYFERVTLDHTNGGGLNLIGGGFTLQNCYWEYCSQYNNPAGQNASFADLALAGGPFTITGGIFASSPTNNKAPIQLNGASFVTFIGVSPFSLGTGAPSYINVSGSTSSAIIIGNSGLTSSGTVSSVSYFSAGYGVANDITLNPTTSVKNSILKVWADFDGTNGTLKQSQNVSSVTRNSAGNYTVNFTTNGTFANANYIVVGSAYGSGVSLVITDLSKLTSSLTFILTNTTNNTATDSTDVMIGIIGV